MATRAQTHNPSLRHRRGEESCAAILAAAERIFAEAGPEGARIDAIAAAAGVNKALLYYYFKSKDDLYRAILEEHLEEFRRRAEEILDSKGPARTTLLNYVSMHFDFISARPYYPRLFQRMLMTDARGLERFARKHRLAIARKFLAVVERGIRAGEFRRVDPVHAAISVVALTVFYFSAAPVVRILTGMDPYDPRNLSRRKEQVLEFIRQGLFRRVEVEAR